MPLKLFHEAVSNWFEKEFTVPTPVQEQAWPAIRSQKHTLIAAPTGSGKTLAAFLTVIDDLLRQGLAGSLMPGTQIVYVSPLKALSNDIERNLQRPLAGITEELASMALPKVSIDVMVRTGDTPASQRTAMMKKPPHILVTTPESLYLLITSESGRRMLKSVHTLIVDEIHALVRDKRGSHLALTMERVQANAEKPITRIGISATQKPIEDVAHFLVGNGNGHAPECTIVDTGHKRQWDLAIEVPRSPLGAVMAHEVWTEIYERIEALIAEHRTTLIFVNTRRLAERIAFTLKEKHGNDIIAAHHGSMSREHRWLAEQRLKSGSLRALVATASLELGIDIGSIDLVCQIASPRSIATFLQRVGRSGHSVTGIPKGRVFPLTRDELVECTALLDAVRHNELDRLIIPEKPIDILAQQIVAEVACEEKTEDELFELATRAYPYRDLSRKEFDEVLTMLSDGFTTRRGRRGAYLFHDMINERLKTRKGARLAALTNGGAIPDTFDYDVVLEPTNTFVGTLNEDFAFESSAGDIFQLANNSWKIMRVETGVVRVADAGGAAPTIPFWLGEAPGRTIELSAAVSRLRQHIADLVGSPEDFGDVENPDDSWKQPAMAWLDKELGLSDSAADQLVTYLAAAKAALNTMPTQETIVLERFFDEAGDMHLVIHSPFGNRMNRAWGLALRKRFCRKFNFELQAAATDDAIVLSLGSTHSFPLDEVFVYLNSKTVREILVQAVFDSPMFEIRWRWNASRSLAMLRRRNGKRVPPQLQRMAAQDLVALVFPDQLACLENIAGDRDVPDHPLVAQTISDCLFEAMDIGSLETLLQKMEAKQVVLESRDLREPSVLSQEILNARPYAFLDDAPLEERRTRAVANRMWSDPAEARNLGKLDSAAIDQVALEAWPEAQSPDELHDALLLMGAMAEEEGRENHWDKLFDVLLHDGRVTRLKTGDAVFWIAAERFPMITAVYPDFTIDPELRLPDRILQQSFERSVALRELVRGRLECTGPVTAETLASILQVPSSDIDQAMLALENDGFVFRGHFTPELGVQEWCERRLLARIHRYTLERLRREISPVSPADFMRFLFAWQHVNQSEKLEGQDALMTVLRQLEGFEAPAASWEGDILPSRISDYDFHWLDLACVSGQIAWGRFQPIRHSKTPVKSTPLMLVQRKNLELWQSMNRTEVDTLTANASVVLRFLQNRGASFFAEIVQKAGLLSSQAEEAIAELVAQGWITADSFNGLRALLVPSKYKLPGNASRGRKQAQFTMDQAGRWSLLSEAEGNGKESLSDPAYLELAASILLKRYGVVFRRLADRETIAPTWRELAKTYRLMEARGEIRGGRFVEGVWGEQFALPEAVTKLRTIRREEKKGVLISISAGDPLNLQGVLSPGKLVTQLPGNRILYKDGEPIAVLNGNETVYLKKEMDEEAQWNAKTALVRRTVSPKLRAYLGKGIA